MTLIKDRMVTILLLSIQLLVILLYCMISSASAYDRISQMDTVCVNQTIDISGVLGGYGQAAWYGGETPYLIEIPYMIRPLSRFYLDPKVFGSRLGEWNKYTGNKGIEHGNMVAFYVKDCRVIKSTTPLINDYYINNFYNFYGVENIWDGVK